MNIPPLKFASKDKAYQSAICHSAIPLVQKINQVFIDMTTDDNSQRLAEFAALTKEIETNPMFECKDTDAESFEHIAKTVLPIIARTYCVREDRVYKDIVQAIDYYTEEWFGKMITELAPRH